MRTLVIGSNGHKLCRSLKEAKENGYNVNGVQHTAYENEEVEINGTFYRMVEKTRVIDNTAINY